MTGHEADHGARIDAAGEEGPDRYVRDHLHPHRFLELHPYALCPELDARFGVDLLRYLPVAPVADLPGLDRKEGGRRQLANAFEDAAWRRDVAEVQITGERRTVEL